MIRYFFILIILGGGLHSGLAQSHLIQTGFNKSNVSWHNLVQHDYNYDWNYFIGYSYEKQLSTNFNLNTAIQFSQKGFVDRAPNNREVSKETYEYIDFIPTISFLPHQSFGYFLGGNVGFLFRDEDELAHDFIDLGLVMGVEYNYKRWKVRAGYNHGLSSIFDESENQRIVDQGISPFNSNFQVNFGYRFFGDASNKKAVDIDQMIEEKRRVEVGVSLYSLNAFTAIIKSQKSNSQYIRYTLALSNINVERTEKFNYNWNLAFSAGIENRIAIDEQIDFVHGLEPGFTTDFSSNSVDFNIGITPYIAYVLGAYYHSESDRFRLGIETTPRFFVHFDFDEQGVVNEWSAGLNLSSRVALVATYCFEK